MFKEKTGRKLLANFKNFKEILLKFSVNGNILKCNLRNHRANLGKSLRKQAEYFEIRENY